jgi:hypothetical protein
MRVRRMMFTRVGRAAGPLGPAGGSTVVVSTAIIENPWAWVRDPSSSRTRLREVGELAVVVGDAVLAAHRPSFVVHCAGIVVGLAGEVEDGWILARTINRRFDEGGRGGSPGSVVVRRGTSLAHTIPSVDESGAIPRTLAVDVRGGLQADEMAAIVVGVDIRDGEVPGPGARRASTKRRSAR